jgi:hypothetical protein
MHEDDGCTCGTGHLHDFWIIKRSTHIVHYAGASGERSARHFRSRCVNGNWAKRCQCRDHWLRTSNLLSTIHARCAGASGFTANIQDASPFMNAALPVRHGCIE